MSQWIIDCDEVEKTYVVFQKSDPALKFVFQMFGPERGVERYIHRLDADADIALTESAEPHREVLLTPA